MATVTQARPQAHSKPRDPLDALFSPRSVAVIGASEKIHSLGRAVLENLAVFRGQVHAVNPNHRSIFGKQSFPSVTDIPEAPDLAVIVTPASAVPSVIRSCVHAKVPAAVILSAGFKECGAEGAALEKKVFSEAREGGLRLLGPNCLGVMTPHASLNATFANRIAEPGPVAFLSQSGALCSAVLDWSFAESLGFSGFVSIGSMIDIGWGDLIDYFGNDPKTKSIVCYMESIGDARAFISAAREVALTKPIIVLKVGHTSAGSQAATSHTGALTGSDAVCDAAFRRAGVLRVNSLDELFDMAEVLAKQPRLHGPHLAIVTNAGGPGALATDMLVASGGKLALLNQETVEGLNRILPEYWSHSNPVDILGDADTSRFKQAIKTVATDPAVDGILTILTPQAMTDATAIAADICECARMITKPLLASWMGGKSVADGEAILNAAHIPTFKTPDDAARAFSLMWQYSDNLRALYETPLYDAPAPSPPPIQAKAHQIVTQARSEKRTLLNVVECAEVLRAYGLSVVESCLASDEHEAVRAATAIGFPVAVKLHSNSLTHKSDVGGVQLNVSGVEAVRAAWKNIRDCVEKRAGPQHFCGVSIQPMIRKPSLELILGSSIDSQFGPTILFGTGGKLVEVYNDTVIGLPPLNSTLALRMIERTRVFAALRGVRGEPPVDLAALEQLIVRFSLLVTDLPLISQIDINPLVATADQIVAVDARMILHPHTASETDLPRPAIRPYPSQFAGAFKLKEGTALFIRPIRPEDESMMINFHQTLSDRSVYMRYFMPLKLDQRIAHSRLSRLCFVDYDREMAFVAEHKTPNGQRHIVGIARLSSTGRGNQAEFSVLVSDEWQALGLGTELLRRLVQFGRDAKLKRISATILEENSAMQHVAAKLGFELRHGEGECVASVAL